MLVKRESHQDSIIVRIIINKVIVMMERSDKEDKKLPENNEIKQRLKGYGMILGYSLVRMFGLGYFAFKIIMIRQ